jgi:ribosomal protein S18 acetylase RimI-like enzyme
MEDASLRQRKKTKEVLSSTEDNIKTLPVKLDDLEMKPETIGSPDLLEPIPEAEVDEKTNEDDDDDDEPLVENDVIQDDLDEDSKDEDRVKLSVLDADDDEAARWLIYKRIFVSDAYGMATENIMTTNFACICFGVFGLIFNYVGFTKAFFLTFLGIPLCTLIVCRTLVLWKLVVRSGPDVRMGVYDYWVKGNKNRSLFTAKYQNRVVGVVAVVALSKKVAEISRVATDRDCIRQGVGGCLVQYVLRICQSTGFEEVVLTVGESNYAACVLFEKFGFRVVRQVSDAIFKVLKWRGFIMKLRLLPPATDVIKEELVEEAPGEDEEAPTAETPVVSDEQCT